MAFFDDLFKSKNKGGSQFPNENGNGKIALEGNKIICTGSQPFDNCTINIDDIREAYIIVSNGRSTLFLFDHHQNWLPTNFKGFQNIYRMLSDRFGFDDKIFFENVFSTAKIKKQLWRRKEAVNYQLIHDGSFHDYGTGYEVQSPDKEFVSWDLPARDFAKKEFIHKQESPYGQQIFKFSCPVRIGNLLIHELCAYENTGRKDAPVLYFYANCNDDYASDKSYFEIKNQLIKDLPPPQSEVIYERQDQNCFTAIANDMNITLVYTYDSEWGFDGSYTSMTIKNERTYYSLLDDDQYGDHAEISDYLIMNVKASGASDYKDNERIKRKVSKLKNISHYDPMIWRDDKNQKIGFADKNYFQVFDMNEIKQIQIRNILPAKGPGGGYLILHLVEDDENYIIFTGSCNTFDQYQERISHLTGKEVIIEADEYDC